MAVAAARTHSRSSSKNGNKKITEPCSAAAHPAALCFSLTTAASAWPVAAEVVGWGVEEQLSKERAVQTRENVVVI
jgi:hypothetical protein